MSDSALRMEKEMDPITRGLLDELKGLLREELISLPKWKEEVATVLREAQEQRQERVNASVSNVVRDESVRVSLSTVKGDDEKEFTSGIGVSALPVKSQHVREDVHVVASAKGLDGDLAYLLHDGSEDHESPGWEPPKFELYACTTTAAPPSLFDAVVQQLTRLNYKSGGEARYMEWSVRMKTRPGREDRWMFAHLRVGVIADIRILTDVEGQRGRLFQSDPQYRFKRVAVPGKAAQWEAARAKCETVLETALVEEWMMEAKLAMLQMDAVIIDVTVDECVNQEGDEGRARIEGHTVVGIYLGRR